MGNSDACTDSALNTESRHPQAGIRRAVYFWHAWSALMVAPVLLVLLLTGSLYLFDREFDEAWQRQAYAVVPDGQSTGSLAEQQNMLRSLYPQATNVEFVKVLGPDAIRLRIWERGTGITLACGSGACATAVAAHLKGLTGRRVRLDVDGGTLWVDWRDDGVWLSGPVAHVFDGVFAPTVLA